jgi:two-component system nitrogen regulation response regulator NtrX
VDVRVIAATNKDLETEIEKGNFRDDLYFRLNVIPITVPALRERVEDIPELVSEFLNDISMRTNLELKEFSQKAMGLLKKYHWPGNVRELKNLVERLVIMTPEKVIQDKDIPPPFNRAMDVKQAPDSSLMDGSFKDAKIKFEKTFIARKLREFNGNISQTAEAIGIERSNLHKKIKAYGLEGFR